MTDIAREAKKRAKIATDDMVQTMNPIKALSDVGFKSELGLPRAGSPPWG